eukprot:118264-Rhodomonas_salina.1
MLRLTAWGFQDNSIIYFELDAGNQVPSPTGLCAGFWFAGPGADEAPGDQKHGVVNVPSAQCPVLTYCSVLLLYDGY